jgi:sugar phosphate isomerase/epimerase
MPFERDAVAETNNLKRLAGLGFHTVDICPSMQQSDQARAALKALELEVTCVSISHEAPLDSTFDSDDLRRVDSMVQHTQTGLKHALEVGAGCAYVVPGRTIDKHSLGRFAAGYAALAEYAQTLGVKLCIEHFPGTVLPTVVATLDFIKAVNHPNLYLLFDLGHAQMSSEDPATVLPLVGDRLGYIHLDDNDGVDDLHLALTDGVQTTESLVTFFKVLADVGYDGPVSLEMKQNLPDPFDAIRRSKALLTDLVDFSF